MPTAIGKCERAEDMLSIVYTSRATISVTTDLLENMKGQFAARNSRLDITGYLYYSNSKFLQYIEGDEEPLKKLFKRIAADSRHKIARVVQSELNQCRRFPQWSMQFLTEPRYVSIEDVLHQQIEYVSIVGQAPPAMQKLWSLVDKVQAVQARLDKH